MYRNGQVPSGFASKTQTQTGNKNRLKLENYNNDHVRLGLGFIRLNVSSRSSSTAKSEACLRFKDLWCGIAGCGTRLHDQNHQSLVGLSKDFPPNSKPMQTHPSTADLTQ